MLNLEQIQQVEKGVQLTGEANCQEILKRVKKILQHARSAFHSLQTSNIWSVAASGRANACFNCDGNHGVDSCDKPIDEQRVARKRQEFKERKARERQEKNQAAGGGGRGTSGQRGPWGGGGGRGGGGRNSSGGGRGRGRGGGRGAQANASYGSGVAKIGGRWLCFCKHEGCNWNDSHTSKFHAAWKKNPNSFSLPAHHEFSIKTSGGGGNQGSGGGEAAGGGAAGGGASAAGAAIGAAAAAARRDAATKAVLEQHKVRTTDPEFSSFLADLQKAWDLN